MADPGDARQQAATANELLGDDADRMATYFALEYGTDPRVDQIVDGRFTCGCRPKMFGQGDGSFVDPTFRPASATPTSGRLPEVDSQGGGDVQEQTVLEPGETLHLEYCVLPSDHDGDCLGEPIA